MKHVQLEEAMQKKFGMLVKKMKIQPIQFRRQLGKLSRLKKLNFLWT
jgi:hypothetical protein